MKHDVIIVGGGLAAMATALDLLDHGLSVVVFDRDIERRLGGLARESFGGIFVVGSPEQRRGGVRDSPELAYRDWCSVAGFGPDDELPRGWAEAYVERSLEDVYHWLRRHSVVFFPVVHWVERGLHGPGNSVPRFHMVWGTGQRLVEALAGHLEAHRGDGRLELRFRHRVTGLVSSNGRVTGCVGEDEASGEPFEAEAGAVVVAAGGICGSVERVRRHWYKPWGKPPAVILNGAHRFGDGTLHDLVEASGGHLTHLDLQWHYAAGVHHPQPDRDHHGLSLVPPKSALWLDATGRRIGPVPLVTGFDTRHLVEEVCRTGYGYSWQVLNFKIARRELAVSGSEFNDAIRDRKPVAFLKTLLLGNPGLVNHLLEHCVDFVSAGSVAELVERMNALTGEGRVEAETLEGEIRRYDDTIRRGRKYHNDEQLRRIAHARQYRGDRIRTCNAQPIDDPEARPLIAIREFILARKSLGGIRTDLQSRVVSPEGTPIPGLYAVGEAAGFGGGGIHGRGSLEGTFLGTCVLTGRVAAKAIRGG